jgi:RimJ/RimL family protein N-acetyltransferase
MKTATITLRPLVAGDLAQLHVWRNDPEVSRHLGRQSATMEELEAWLEAQRGIASEGAYAVVADESLIGYAVLNGADVANRRCEAGIVIGERALWGQGIGTIVARELAHIAFTELGMHRVAAVASEMNPASIRCFLNAGFQEEGRMREARLRDGVFVDLVVMSMLEGEETPPNLAFEKGEG